MGKKIRVEYIYDDEKGTMEIIKCEELFGTICCEGCNHPITACMCRKEEFKQEETLEPKMVSVNSVLEAMHNSPRRSFEHGMWIEENNLGKAITDIKEVREYHEEKYEEQCKINCLPKKETLEEKFKTLYIENVNNQTRVALAQIAKSHYQKHPNDIIGQDEVIIKIKALNDLTEGYNKHLNMVSIDKVLECFDAAMKNEPHFMFDTRKKNVVRESLSNMKEKK